MFKKLFSFQGRLRRRNYLITIIVYLLFLMMFLFTFASIILGSVGGSPLFLLLPLLIFFWIFFAQGSKRCHDLDKSGWYQLIPFYVLWMLFKPGIEGRNRFGPDSKIAPRNMDDILDGDDL